GSRRRGPGPGRGRDRVRLAARGRGRGVPSQGRRGPASDRAGPRGSEPMTGLERACLRYQAPSTSRRAGVRVLVIDNYDSFTFNLVQYLLELGADVDVHRNDAITVEQVLADAPSHLLLSPGPGQPKD